MYKWYDFVYKWMVLLQQKKKNDPLHGCIKVKFEFFLFLGFRHFFFKMFQFLFSPR